MAEIVVSFALEGLGDLLIEKVKFLYGVRGQVEEIQEELRQIQCFLKDTDAKQDEHETIRHLVAEIREVAYNAEDVITTFVFEVASRKRRGGGIRNIILRSACFLNGIMAHNKVGSDVENIKSKITRLTTSLQSYGVIAAMEIEGSSSTLQRRGELRRSYSHVIEEDFVGFEEDMRILVEKLVNEDKPCRVVSICGMGGLGKTTLARNVYHHRDIRFHFDSFAWASISQNLQKKEVLKSILSKLKPRERKRIENMKIEDELVREVYEVQQQKKCLVVLDDIWSSDAWDILSPAFPSANMGCKILITTRNAEVARHMDQSGYLHELKCLSKEESWELFQKKAFPKRDSTGDDAEEIPRLKEYLAKEYEIKDLGSLKYFLGIEVA